MVRLDSQELSRTENRQKEVPPSVGRKDVGFVELVVDFGVDRDRRAATAKLQRGETKKGLKDEEELTGRDDSLSNEGTNHQRA